MQYISPNRFFAVHYLSMSRPGAPAGSYDVLKVEGGSGSATWPVVSNHDWFQQAREDADRRDREEFLRS